MSTPMIIMLIVLVVLIGVCVALYFFGKKAQKKQAEQQQQMDAVAQTISMLIIDKKKMKLKDAGLPAVVLENTPKYLRRSKVPVVKAKVGPKNATSKAVTWKSSDKKIATVSSKGVVTAKKAGRVTITCTAKDGSNVYATCSVTVANPVKTIKLNKKKVTIKKKGTYLLKATVGPKSAGNKTVKWTSSNKKVATVSASGLVTAKKKGKVTITVKAKDGSKKTAKCIVTVK